jgi:hypothetical protein
MLDLPFDYNPLLVNNEDFKIGLVLLNYPPHSNVILMLK